MENDLAISEEETFWAVIAVLLATIALIVVLFMSRIKNIKASNQNILTEQKLLRSQMTPHFIFNSLSILQGIILNKEYDKSVKYLSKFSRLLRLILENSRETAVALVHELKALENYLQVQNLVAKHPYRYTVEVDENIDSQKISIPPMIIQPFVENAIEHAFPDEEPDRNIEIKISLIDNKLFCTIADNGIGLILQQEKSFSTKKSLSTTITIERLKMLSKEFKVPTDISIVDRSLANSHESGTLVKLMLPYR